MENAFAVTYRPSLIARFWRWLGYTSRPFAEMPPEAELMPGWAMTNVRLDLSFGDRIRVLVSGRIKIAVEQHFDAKVDNVVSISRVSFPFPFSTADD